MGGRANTELMTTSAPMVSVLFTSGWLAAATKHTAAMPEHRSSCRQVLASVTRHTRVAALFLVFVHVPVEKS